MRALTMGRFVAVALLVPLLTSCLSVAFWAYQPLPTTPEEELVVPSDRFIDVAGLRLRYRDEGPRSGATVVLLHGFAGNLGTWDQLTSLLTPRLRVIRLDLVGFGLSDKPTTFDYRYASQAEVVARFLEALDVNDVLLAGHSMGGNIALRTALISPHVGRLALLDPGLVNDGVPSFVSWVPWPYPRASARLFADPGFRTSGLRGAFADPSLVTSALVEGFLLAPKTPGYAEAMEAMLRSYRPPNEVALIPQVRQPTLLLWGEFDKHNPASTGRDLVGQFSQARLFLIPGSGHYIQEERPADVAAQLLAFVDES